jgi:hypothetical protein
MTIQKDVPTLTQQTMDFTLIDGCTPADIVIKPPLLVKSVEVTGLTEYCQTRQQRVSRRKSSHAVLTGITLILRSHNIIIRQISIQRQSEEIVLTLRR